MKIKRLDISELNIPFKHTFGHASATRSTTEAVLVKAESEKGITGYGEGCPRSYVTGESLKSAQVFFDKYNDEFIQFETLENIKQWVQDHQDVIDQNPAAWCAIELALLDLLGKENKQAIETLLSLPSLSGIFQYSAVLGSNTHESYKNQLQQYIHTGFTDYKIKVSGILEEDKQKINALREFSENIRVRLDANNLWKSTQQAIDHVAALDYPFFAIEEPLEPNDYDGCQTITDALNIPVILDESFLRLGQFKQISNGDPTNWIINLRISKMGGIMRSLAIAERSKILGIPLIVGAQVGETSILTRAALTVANTYRDILLAQEGAFGTHLLEKDIIESPVMFGQFGELDTLLIGSKNGLSIG